MKNNLIISRTPLRVSFFGGGTDYPRWYLKHGGSVLSTSIDKYIYITCRPLPPFFKHKYRIVWSETERVKKIEHIKLKPVREMLKKFKIKNGLEIHYDGDLPSRSGMGSSSVFVVGLMNLLYNFQGKKIEKKQLAKKSIYFEQSVLRETVGSQDQIASVYGGFNKIKFKTNGDFSVEKINLNGNNMARLNKNLLLIYTGYKRTAHDIAKSYVNKLKSAKEKNILKILSFVEEGKQILKKGDLNDFGKLLHEAWLEKKDLSSAISNSSIDDIYNIAIKNGALGGKLIGAGGGGFFLFYVPYYMKKNFINKFTKFINVPFKFSSKGSEILYKDKVDRR